MNHSYIYAQSVRDAFLKFVGLGKVPSTAWEWVEVMRGRKVPIGTIGQVTNASVDAYGNVMVTMRTYFGVSIKTSIKNVAVITDDGGRIRWDVTSNCPAPRDK